MTVITEESIRQLYDARLKNDITELLPLLDENATMRMAGRNAYNPLLGEADTANTITAYIVLLVGKFDWNSYEIKSLICDAQSAAVRVEVNLTYTPSGMTITTEFADFFTFRGEKVSEFIEFMDTAQIAQLVQTG